MRLYRIEREDGSGMWYNHDGTENRVIDNLDDKRLSQLPMEYDPRYNGHGKNWVCSTDDLDGLGHWFKIRDVQQLVQLGYQVYEYEATEYVIEAHNHQTLFTKESATSKKNITDIFFLKLNQNYMRESKVTGKIQAGIRSIYGGELLVGDVILFGTDFVRISFEGGYHVETYDVKDVIFDLEEINKSICING